MISLQGTLARLIFISPAVVLVVFAATLSAQVRQSYFERSTDTIDLIQNMTDDDRLRMADGDRLTEAFEQAMDTGRYRDAIDIAERQLEIRRRLLGARHPELIPPLIGHGFASWRQNRYAEGEKSLRLAREIIADHLGESHPEMARCLDLLGLCRMAQGFHKEAKQLYFQALSITLETCGENHPLAIACYDDLGAVHQEQSDLIRAEPFQRKALALARKLYGTNHLVTARQMFNLGKLTGRCGDLAETEALYTTALAIRQRLLGDEHPDVAFNLGLLGRFYMHRGKLDEAESMFEESLAISRKVLGDEHSLVWWNMENLATIYSRQKRYEDALQVAIPGLALRRRSHGNTHPNVLRGLRDISGIYTYLGDYDRAERCLHEALDLLSEPALESLTGAGIYPRLGRIALLRGDLERAEEMYSTTAGLFEEARLSRADFKRRISFASEWNPYLQLAAIRLLLGKTDEAWPAAERYLGRALFDLLVSSGERRLAGPETAYEDSLNTVLSGLEKQYSLLKEESENIDGPDLTAAIGEVRTRLLETEAEWGIFRQQMRSKYPVTEGDVFPLERIQSSLDEHTAIIGWLDHEPLAGKPLSWAFVIRADGPVHWVNLRSEIREEKRENHERLPENFRMVLAGAASWPYRVESVDKIQWLAKDLYRRRILPAVTFLEGIENLVVIPSGRMQGVPVETLIDDRGRCLCERFTISYTSSGTVYAWLEERTPSRGSPGYRALVVGDPRLTAGNDRISVVPLSLPASRREVDRVASLVSEAVTLCGNRASEQALVQLGDSLGRFDMIHVSTHASVDPERPERSHLTLSQENLPDPLESAISGKRIYDGKLTLREILLEWKLDADLVTLSACQTAVGKSFEGEGFVGLAYAFLQAGARSVVVSLWAVDDEATSLLMGRFYENLTGAYSGERMPGRQGPLPKATALGEAKRWLRDYKDESGRTPFRHPAYWSAFILIGDPG